MEVFFCVIICVNHLFKSLKSFHTLFTQNLKNLKKNYLGIESRESRYQYGSILRSLVDFERSRTSAWNSSIHGAKRKAAARFRHSSRIPNQGFVIIFGSRWILKHGKYVASYSRIRENQPLCCSRFKAA